jgi:hypothetical protein
MSASVCAGINRHEGEDERALRERFHYRAAFVLGNCWMTDVTVRHFDIACAVGVFYVDVGEIARIVADKVLPFRAARDWAESTFPVVDIEQLNAIPTD